MGVLPLERYVSVWFHWLAPFCFTSKCGPVTSLRTISRTWALKVAPWRTCAYKLLAVKPVALKRSRNSQGHLRKFFLSSPPPANSQLPPHPSHPCSRSNRLGTTMFKTITLGARAYSRVSIKNGQKFFSSTRSYGEFQSSLAMTMIRDLWLTIVTYWYCQNKRARRCLPSSPWMNRWRMWSMLYEENWPSRPKTCVW